MIFDEGIESGVNLLEARKVGRMHPEDALMHTDMIKTRIMCDQSDLLRSPMQEQSTQQSYISGKRTANVTRSHCTNFRRVWRGKEGSRR